MNIAGTVLCVLGFVVVMIRAIVGKEELDKLFLGIFGTFIVGGFVFLLAAKYDWDPTVLVVLALAIVVSLQASRLPQLSGKKESTQS